MEIMSILAEPTTCMPCTTKNFSYHAPLFIRGLSPKFKKSCDSVTKCRCPSGPPLWAATPDTEELHHGPRVPGTLGMELGRHMNQIHEVNVDGAYALVELGVTFFSLYDHLVKTGLDEQLWLDAKEGRFSPKVD
ncbi:vanillyl-alcohol oxidase [Verticillium dahliae]|nr:vanillyl-alcohol oxidase [Verticillium dahliae]